MQPTLDVGPKSRWLGRAAGLSALIISLGFIAFLAWTHAQALSNFRPGVSEIALLGLSATIYGGGGILAVDRMAPFASLVG